MYRACYPRENAFSPFDFKFDSSSPDFCLALTFSFLIEHVLHSSEQNQMMTGHEAKVDL